MSLLRLNRSITSARRRLSPTITSAVITRTVWHLHLYDNYSETRTVVNVFLFNFASGMVNRTRLKGLLRSSGLGGFYYPNHPVNIACGRKPDYPEEVYDCRLTLPDWRELLRSYRLRRFYNCPNHPVNMSVGGNRSTRRKLTTVGKALTNSSHKCHESEGGIEPTISELTGACTDECATW